MATAAPHPARSARWAPLLLLICTLLPFARLTAARFTSFDDRGTITENPHLNPPTWSGIAHFWAHPAADIYAPLTYTAWGLLAKATWVSTPDEFGVHVDPRVYHAVNLLLHATAALCVYALLVRLTRIPWAALAGGLLFALHPVQVEPVAWASGTKDVLAGALSLAALLFYIRFAQSTAARDRRRWYLAATITFAAALLAKPSAASAPLIAAILDRLILRRSWRQLIPPLSLWIFLSLPIILVNRIAQQATGARFVPLWFRPFIPGDAVTFYLSKLILPIHLAIQYPLRPTHMIHQPWAYAGWIIPALLAAILWRARRPWLSAAALIFAAAPLPVLGFLPFDWQWYSAVADHYLYVAMLGPALALAFALSHTTRRLAALATTAWLIALGVASFHQAGFWTDNTTLAQHALAVNPDSFIAHTLLATDAFDTDPERAISEYRKVLAIEPTYWTAAGKLKSLLDRTGRKDEALQLMIQGLTLNESLPADQQFDATNSYRQLAETFEAAGDYPKSAQYYEKLLRAHPSDASAAQALQRVRSKIKGYTSP
jgi:tetratricopeptide (TPR) repeat protein